MSDTKAIAVKAFQGAPDGDAYPRSYQKGDPVAGDLADVAISQKWARESRDEAEFTAAVEARADRVAAERAAEDA